MSAQACDYSIIIPVYNAEKSVGPLVDSILEKFKGQGTLQIVLVNDGSQDGSDAVCSTLAETLPGTVTYLRLSKNFGEHNAVIAGLRHSLGAHVVIMDDDGQNTPADALRLFEAARAGGYDLVYSVYPKKEHSPLRNLGSRFNGMVANWMISKPRDLYLSSFKCMSRWLTDEVLRYHGPFPYIDGLALRCTRNIGQVEVAHQKRAHGRSGYTLRKLVRLWLNMFVNFSLTPLRASIFLGLALLALAAVFIAAIMVEWLSGRPIPRGWPSLAIITMLFSGTQLFMLGVIGEYLGRLFLAANETPQASVREIKGLQPRSRQ